MIWLGIIIGFCAGVVLVTLLYTPLVEKVKLLEAKSIRDTDLVNDCIKTLRTYERQNRILRDDLDNVHRLRSLN